MKETADSPLAITVTPCAAHINWKVTFREFHFNSEFEPDSTPSPAPILLQNFSGGVANTYRENQGRKGLYIVELVATTSETYARIYVTTTPDMDYVFPQLPTDDRVDITMKTTKDISIMWKPSPSTTDKIEYCIVFSRKRQFHSHCGVLAHLYGDVKPTLPPNTGFGFEGEKERRKFLRKSAKPIRSAPKGHIFYDCVGSERSYTFKKAKSGRKYFVNVFAINRATNMSISYAGVQVKLKRGKKKRLVLKEGKMQTLIFKRKKAPKILFSLSKNVKALNLFLQACGGVMKIRVTKNKKKKIARASIKLFKKLVLKNLESGDYQISISGEKKSRGLGRSLTLLLQDNSSHIDVPKLPEHAQVTVLNNLTLCNQVTIAWNSTEEQQRYCLYKSELPNIPPETSTNWKTAPQCIAFTTRKKSGKVLCKLAPRVANKQEMLTETIEKLSPGTSYIFSVYVGSREREMFAYQSALVTTKSHC